MKLSTQAYCKMVLHGAKYPHCAVNGLLVAEKQPQHHHQPQHHQRGREREPTAPHLPAHALFVDCIPLFHSSLALAPMLEVALTLIDSWCKENSYVIAGYYQANERVKDASPNQVAEKVASRIAEGFNDTALIMVDNSKFTMDCIEPTVHVYEHHENKWRCKDPHFSARVVSQMLQHYIRSRVPIQDRSCQNKIKSINWQLIIETDHLKKIPRNEDYTRCDYCEDWSEAQRISASLLDSRSYETLVDFDNHLDDIRNDWTNPEINKAVLHLC